MLTSSVDSSEGWDIAVCVTLAVYSIAVYLRASLVALWISMAVALGGG